MNKLLTKGTGFSKSDFAAPFSEFDHRARFLSYFVLVIDYRVRMLLYKFIPVYPTFSITWLLTILVAPYLLFRVCQKLDFGFYPSVFATVIYLTSVGVLSDISMFFLPGKPLSMFLMLLILYLSIDLIKSEQSAPPSRLLQRRLQIGGLILAGLFLDELFFVVLGTVPIIVLALHGLSMRRYAQQSKGPQVVRDVLMVLLPMAIFLGLTIWIVPKITLHYHGYRLDYLGAMMNTVPMKDPWPAYQFSGSLLLRLTLTLLGMSLVPYQLSPIVALPTSGVITAQVTNGAQLVLLLLAVTGFSLLLVRSRGPKRSIILGVAMSMVVAIVMISIMQGHHIPVVTGYYYGCIFAVFFALAFGAALDSFSITWNGAAARWICLGFTVVVSGIQLDNFFHVNRSFVDYHNVRRPAANVSFRTIAEQPLTWAEVRKIHEEWKHGNLDDYLKTAMVSDGAWYLITELRQIDRLRQLNRR